MGGQWSGGKGDQARRLDKAKFDENYERIFRSKTNARLGQQAELHDGGSAGCGRGKESPGPDLPVRPTEGGGVDAEGGGEV